MGEVIDKIENIGIVFCSVDAPQLPRTRIVTNNAIYLRIHGYNTRMPHMNGYEFVQVKMKKPDVKVFLMSAFEFTDSDDTCYSSHIEGFLEKPVSLLKLNEIVIKHIGNNPILNQESYISTDRTNGTTDGHVP